MSYEAMFHKNGDVLHVKAVGARTVESIKNLSREIMQAAAEHGTLKVLIDVS